LSHLRVPCELPGGDRCDLEGDAARYLLRARRAAIGDTLVAFDPVRAVETDAVLIAATKSTATLELGPLRPASVLPRRAVTLLQAVGKGDKLDAIVRDATELGATRVVPVATARSVPRRDAAAMARRLERVAIEAARQAGRGDVPRIDPPSSLADAVASLDATVRVALIPGGSVALADALAGVAGSVGVAFAVGPEGGFDDAEIELLGAAGFVPTTLGPVILRTETVCAAVLGALLARA
jgi:16S rRNA (uracil1498-N3)-methyltransferase